jgi:hypothetical protein
MRVDRGEEYVIGGYTIGATPFDALIFGHYQDNGNPSKRPAPLVLNSSVCRAARLHRHRIACGGPRFNAALECLDVGKPLRPEVRCLTDSTAFGGSSAVENEFLCLRQRTDSGLKARQ